MGKLWVTCPADCGENRPVFWQLLFHISSMKTPRLRCSCTLLSPTTWGPGLKSMASMTRIWRSSVSKSKAPQRMGRWEGGNYRHVKMVMFALATSLRKWFTGLQPSWWLEQIQILKYFNCKKEICEISLPWCRFSHQITCLTFVVQD